MRYLVTVLLLAVACASAASATGIMNVRSNLKSDVYLDDQMLGSTPLTISEIPFAGPGGAVRVGVTRSRPPCIGTMWYRTGLADPIGIRRVLHPL